MTGQLRAGLARLWQILAVSLILALPGIAAASGDPARVEVAQSALRQGDPVGWFGRNRPRPIDLHLTLERAVPFRLFLLDGPPRLVIDLQGADFGTAAPADLAGTEAMPAIRWGRFRDGWARMVIELPGAFRIDRAVQTVARDPAPDPGQAVIRIALSPVATEDFVPRTSADAALRGLPLPADLPPVIRDPDAPLMVVLDPGHGGMDPGAQAGDDTEAEIVLLFARELAERLRAKGVQVGLTRDADRFLDLESRMTVARTSRAGLFLSIHADALPAGEAAGATVYVWNPDANDAAARRLAMSHDRDDLLAGMDLGGTDDGLASTLMDIARTDTQPRSENFAKFLASRMALDGIGMHQRPVKGAHFAVLKSPDIPSALLELGFLSDPRDRAKLTDPAWRARMASAIADAIIQWDRDDRARRPLLRQ